MAHWPITLDDAILIVLHDRPDRTAGTAHISEQINQRRLYVHKDGTGVFPEQIFLRARRDPAFFEIVDRETIRSLFTSRWRAVKG
jgi:hypothetical protein